MRPLVERSPRRVDIDTFDRVLREWRPRVALGADESGEPVLLEFGDMDGFHPDALADRIPETAALLELRRRLLDAATSTRTVAELRNVAGDRPASGPAEAQPETDPALLERLLGRPGPPAGPTAASAVSASQRDRDRPMDGVSAVRW